MRPLALFMVSLFNRLPPPEHEASGDAGDDHDEGDDVGAGTEAGDLGGQDLQQVGAHAEGGAHPHDAGAPQMGQWFGHVLRVGDIALLVGARRSRDSTREGDVGAHGGTEGHVVETGRGAGACM
jgi:hypothetical protein